ncbi:hypothetical protein ES708_29102 [subsurface metagenome]
MKDFNSIGNLYALVIGSRTDDFIDNTIELLGECNVGFVVCGDIYQAIAELAKKNESGNILVIGRLIELNKEESRFFQKAGEYNCKFCCFAGKQLTGKNLQDLTDIETDIFIVSEPDEVGDVLIELFEKVSNNQKFKKKHKISTSTKDKLLTQAEIDALLGS